MKKRKKGRRFKIWATGPLSEGLIEQAVSLTVQHAHQRELYWFSDGWYGYRNILERAYRKPVWTGKRGHPRLVVPESVTLTQTVKHRDEHGRLLSVEIRAALREPAGTVHVERLNGALRDRLTTFTPKTHAFAKRDATWVALVGLQLFDHNLSSSPSELAAASCRWRTPLSPSTSGDGSGADRSSLDVQRIVDDSNSYHPLMGPLPTLDVWI